MIPFHLQWKSGTDFIETQIALHVFLALCLSGEKKRKVKKKEAQCALPCHFDSLTCLSL